MTISRICYVDCTGTFNSGLNTGIQRVVRNILSRLDGLEDYRGYRFVPVISVGSELYVLDVDFRKSFYLTRGVNRLLGAGWNVLGRLFGLNSRDHADLPGGKCQEAGKRFDLRSLPARLHEVTVTVCRNIIPFLLRMPPFLDTFVSGNKRVRLQLGDVFLLADSFWNVNSFNAAKKAKACRARIVLLMYDIIPLTHPGFFDQTTWFLFADYFPKYLNLVDGIISISQFTMYEVEKQCIKYGLVNQLALDYFYLGADFSSGPLSQSSEKKGFNDLAGEKFFIMVGTIEPRKNHMFVVDAFERLWEDGSGIRLCIVGKVGWKSDDILKRITGSKYFKKNLFFYENLDDYDLSCLMLQASAVIVASIVEGFGLPLIEARHLGKTVLASDIPVFREIGGDYPLYFSLDDGKSLIGKISLVADGKYTCAHTDEGWISWDDSVKTLLGKVIDIAKGRS